MANNTVEENLSLFTCADSWMDEDILSRKVVWETDAFLLAEQAVELDLLYSVEPYSPPEDINPEEIVWSKDEVATMMVTSLLKKDNQKAYSVVDHNNIEAYFTHNEVKRRIF